jgi:ribosome-binding factor A
MFVPGVAQANARQKPADAVAGAAKSDYIAQMAQKRISSGSGPSQRQLRVGEMIRRTLSDLLSRGEIHDPVLNAMSITVGEVAVSPDLKVATVYVTPLMGEATPAEAVAALARNKHQIRMRVTAEMTLRWSPELRFRADETYDRLEESRRLFADPKVARDVAAPDHPEPDHPEPDHPEPDQPDPDRSDPGEV